jgi:hypothetical protein
MLIRLLVLLVACGALGSARGLGATSSVPPADAPPVVIAAQYLIAISESKTKPMAVACVTFPAEGSKGFVVDGAAIVKGNVMLLSTRYVCQPLAYAWRHAPIFTGHQESTLPFSSVDAVETIAHEWFHTRGVASEGTAECHAVQYTWKWLRRSNLSPDFVAIARQHLLNNSRRPPGYKIPSKLPAPRMRLLNPHRAPASVRPFRGERFARPGRTERIAGRERTSSPRRRDHGLTQLQPPTLCSIRTLT